MPPAPPRREEGLLILELPESRSVRANSVELMRIYYRTIKKLCSLGLAAAQH
jgi:hypothetical protein